MTKPPTEQSDTDQDAGEKAGLATAAAMASAAAVAGVTTASEAAPDNAASIAQEPEDGTTSETQNADSAQDLTVSSSEAVGSAAGTASIVPYWWRERPRASGLEPEAPASHHEDTPAAMTMEGVHSDIEPDQPSAITEFDQAAVLDEETDLNQTAENDGGLSGGDIAAAAAATAATSALFSDRGDDGPLARGGEAPEISRRNNLSRIKPQSRPIQRD